MMVMIILYQLSLVLLSNMLFQVLADPSEFQAHAKPCKARIDGKIYGGTCQTLPACESFMSLPPIANQKGGLVCGKKHNLDFSMARLTSCQ